MRDRIKGSIPALITPMKDGKVDEAAFRKFVDWQIAEGTHGLVPSARPANPPRSPMTNISAWSNSASKSASGRVPVIAGAGSNATARGHRADPARQDVGADAVLSVAPYYNKPTQEGIYRHFAAIAEAVDIPIMRLQHPGRSRGRISVETMARLSKIANIVGVKDATGNLARASRERGAACQGFVRLISGEDGRALGYMAHGGHGLHFGDGQRGAEAVRRIPERLHAGRFRDGARAAGPADAAARRAVLRGEPGARRNTRASLLGHVRATKCACRSWPLSAGARETRARGDDRGQAAERLMAKKKDDGSKVVADNRKARYNYFIDDTLEAGIMLTGSRGEVACAPARRPSPNPTRRPRTARSFSSTPISPNT